MDPQNNIDATSVFGVAKPKSSKEEAFHRELERRSLDEIRIKNPDTMDFFVEWDKRYWRVPAGGTLDVPRYIAIKYCKDKAVDTINRLNEKMHAKDLEERSAKGLPAFESKWHEAQATYEQPRYPKTNDRELLAKLYGEYWVGLVSEFGRDNIPQNFQTQGEQELDLTPIELKIIKDLENRRVSNTDNKTVISQEKPFAKFETPAQQPESKEEMVNEVTIEEDAKTEPTTTG